MACIGYVQSLPYLHRRNTREEEKRGAQSAGRAGAKLARKVKIEDGERLRRSYIVARPKSESPHRTCLSSVLRIALQAVGSDDYRSENAAVPAFLNLWNSVERFERRADQRTDRRGSGRRGGRTNGRVDERTAEQSRAVDGRPDGWMDGRRDAFVRTIAPSEKECRLQFGNLFLRA